MTENFANGLHKYWMKDKARGIDRLKDGTWTGWLTLPELRAHSDSDIQAALIEETMSYSDAMKYLNVRGSE